MKDLVSVEWLLMNSTFYCDPTYPLQMEDPVMIYEQAGKCKEKGFLSGLIPAFAGILYKDHIPLQRPHRGHA